jgi:hypothetical protein
MLGGVTGFGAALVARRRFHRGAVAGGAGTAAFDRNRPRSDDRDPDLRHRLALKSSGRSHHLTLGTFLAAALAMGVAVGAPLAHELPQQTLRRVLAFAMVAAGFAMLGNRAARFVSVL